MSRLKSCMWRLDWASRTPRTNRIEWKLPTVVAAHRIAGGVGHRRRLLRARRGLSWHSQAVPELAGAAAGIDPGGRVDRGAGALSEFAFAGYSGGDPGAAEAAWILCDCDRASDPGLGHRGGGRGREGRGGRAAVPDHSRQAADHRM